MKRGQISVPFTWMFGILAGVAVLSFILIIINSLREESNLSTSITVLEHIDTELTAVAKTQNTFNQINTPKTKLNILCSDKDTSGLLLEGSDNIKATRFQPIFAPETLEGNIFLAWTMDWNLPTPLSRFLYLANPNVKFVIVQDSAPSDLWEQFLNLFPEQYEFDLIQLGEVTNYNTRGYDEYVFVFFSPPGLAPPVIQGVEILSLRNSKVSAINIIPDSIALGEGGEIEFYELVDGIFDINGVSYYIDFALMYGAVFSNSLDHYLCNLDKAMTQLEIHTNINLGRATQMIGFLPSSAQDGYECTEMYSELPSFYNEILTNIGITQANLLALKDVAAELSVIEKDLRKGRACPTL